jgi:acetoin utilization deacetylase AcuC-like enzyme
MTTGYVFHEYYLWHDTGSSAQMMPPDRFVEPGHHVEAPATKRRLNSLIQVSGLGRHLVTIEPEPVSVEDLARVHTRQHIDNIRELSIVGGVYAGPQAPIGRGSYEIALLSAGGTWAAMAAVISGRVDNAYALVRPPGHHAEPDSAMGYCLFGNAPVAIRRLQAERLLGRVAVVDWDVHHGNGTESAFYDDPSVLTISVHQDNLYPVGRGGVGDIGRGAGEGFNLNIPLPPGSGTGAYEAAFDRVVLPALKAFSPDMIVVTSGFDGSGFDPLGRMMLNSECYRRLARRITAAAAELCGGRLVMTHEGGYSEGYVPFCGHAVIETLAGVRSEVIDPLSDHMDEWGGQGLQPHQDAMIVKAEKLVPYLASRLSAKAV